MRFEVQEEVLGLKHPQWPGQKFYRVYDTEKKRYNYGMYTTKERAEQVRGELEIKHEL
jgi:hypothetical protein